MMTTESGESPRESETHAERDEAPPFEIPKTERINVADLHYGAADVRSVNYSWADHDIGTEWEPYEAVECEECGGVYSDSGEEKCPLGHPLSTGEGPMMSYYYPLPGFRGDPNEAAKRIVDLPLCLVYFPKEDDYALALTGGGMNLQWEICEAFIRLGYLPPVRFSDLPNMAGRGKSKRDQVIIRACLRSFDGARDRATAGIDELRRMLKR